MSFGLKSIWAIFGLATLPYGLISYRSNILIWATMSYGLFSFGLLSLGLLSLGLLSFGLLSPHQQSM